MENRFSAGVLKTAKRLMTEMPENITRHPLFENVWFVRSLRHPEEVYRIQTGELEGEVWTLCDCTHGKHNSGQSQCYHAAAVTAIIENGGDW